MNINQTIATVVRKAVPQPVRRLIPLSVRRAIAMRMKVTRYDILGDHVSFREEGFVEAPTPAFLLARHNHEVGTIRAFLGGSTFRKALEIGCGYGRLSPVISEYAHELKSIDVNPEALDLARRCYPALTYRQAAGNTLPFEDDTFDLIVSWTVLQHVPPNQFEQVTTEMTRALAPGGTILLCEQTREIESPVTPETLTWKRTLGAYRDAFPQLHLQKHGLIEALEDILGLDAPGSVMLFRECEASSAM